jgi:hypothetical protein
MPLAVANSVGEPSAHFTVERLRTAYGEESVAHSHSRKNKEKKKEKKKK